MSKRRLIVTSFVGLIFAIAAALVLPVSVRSQQLDLLELGLSIVVAGAAGFAILGLGRAHRYYKLGIPVLAAVAAFAFTTSATNYLLGREVEFGPAPIAPTSAVIVTIVIGAVAYLLAATVYGFAGTRQGVPVGSRVGLLVLLLLAVVPVLAVPGLVGFVVAAFVRKPRPSPGTPQASD